MTRRRTRVKPSARTDWRALAAPSDRRRLALPVAVCGADAADVELSVRTDVEGRSAVVLVASVTWTDADDVDAFADRALDAARALRHATKAEPGS